VSQLRLNPLTGRWGTIAAERSARPGDFAPRYLPVEADPARPRYICTVRGLGYRFAETADELRADQGLRAVR